MSFHDADTLENAPTIDEYRDLLEKVYQDFSRRTDAPQSLRDLIYETIGRILP